MSSGSKGNSEQGIALSARAAVADSHRTLPWVDRALDRLRTIARLEAEACDGSNHVGAEKSVSWPKADAESFGGRGS